MRHLTKDEDVARFIGVELGDVSAQGANVLQLKNIRAYGPNCMGCREFGMTLMLSYMIEDDPERRIHDTYLDGWETQKLLSALTPITSQINQAGMALRLECLGGNPDTVLFLGPKMAEGFIEEIARSNDEIHASIKAEMDAPRLKRQFSWAVEMGPPTPRDHAERVAAQEFLDSYYKTEPDNILVDDIDAGLLLAALYNNAKTGGTGSQHFRAQQMSPAEGWHILREVERLGHRPEFDYINGRSLKIWFDELDGKRTIRFSRYWDYNDLPVMFVVEGARLGQHERMHGQDILDLENEVRIKTQNRGTKVGDVKAIAAAYGLGSDIGSQLDYIASVQDSAPSTYQVTLINVGEIGELIQLFAVADVGAELPAYVTDRRLH